MRFFLVLFSIFFLPFAQAETKNSSEAGVVAASGNSRSQSLSFKQASSRDWGRNTALFKGNFLQSKSFGVLDSKRWDFGLRFERALSQKFGFYVGQSVESDRFAGYMQRYNSDIGPKYTFLKDPAGITWIGEIGYRYSRERRLDSSRLSKNQVRVYSEVNQQWNEKTSSKFWMEYLPNFSNATDWELNSELSTSATFTQILSLKAAYLVKYDHLPAPTATQKKDSLFTTSLVATY